MVNAVEGIDASYDNLTPAKAVDMIRYGKRVYWQCLWTGTEQPANRTTNLRNASFVGFDALVAYASITQAQSGDWHVDMARQGFPADLWSDLAAVAVDVELGGITLLQVEQALDRIAALGKAKRLVYCNYDTWVNVLGNPDAPACAFVIADWAAPGALGTPGLAFPAGHVHTPKWTQVVGRQWQGQHVEADGFTCDSDTFDLDFFVPPAPPPPPPPPPPGPAKTHQIDVYSDGSYRVVV